MECAGLEVNPAFVSGHSRSPATPSVRCSGKRRRERSRSRAFSTTLANRVAEKVRTDTLKFLRSETKARFVELRQRLSTDEQALLVLRINEKMSWEDIARIQLDAPTDGTVKREAARLRKRFQLVRDKLRKMARAEGLLAKQTSMKCRRGVEGSVKLAGCGLRLQGSMDRCSRSELVKVFFLKSRRSI